MNEMIYGIHAVSALLANYPECVSRVLVQQGRRDEAIQHCLSLCHQSHIDVEHQSRQSIDRQFKSAVVHQGIVAFCRQLPLFDDTTLVQVLSSDQPSKLILILDTIQDPHNLGACLRVADAMGCCCVIAAKSQSTRLTPAAIKVSSGAAFTIPFVQVSNLARAMEQCREAGIWLVGLTAETDLAIRDVDTRGHVGVVMGAEGQGLRALTMKHCDYLASIPMFGCVESLNVSVAAGIALYEVRRGLAIT